MNSTSTAHFGYHRGDSDELLSLVERGCVRLMRAGGGALPGEYLQLRPEQAEVLRAKCVARYLELAATAPAPTSCRGTVDIHAIADEVGVHYQTAIRYTAPYRHLNLRGPRK